MLRLVLSPITATLIRLTVQYSNIYRYNLVIIYCKKKTLILSGYINCISFIELYVINNLCIRMRIQKWAINIKWIRNCHNCFTYLNFCWKFRPKCKHVTFYLSFTLRIVPWYWFLWAQKSRLKFNRCVIRTCFWRYIIYTQFSYFFVLYLK